MHVISLFVMSLNSSDKNLFPPENTLEYRWLPMKSKMIHAAPRKKCAENKYVLNSESISTLYGNKHICLLHA